MQKLDMATLAGGCFWCVETLYKNINGVKEVVSGYTGGHDQNPDYWSVHKNSGYAEAIQITFDPQTVSYEDILYIFWRIHDPTTLNQQGVDVGPEYRSAIFYHDEKQRQTAEKSKAELEKAKVYKDPIVTEVVKLEKFFPAEVEHQDYYAKNVGNIYCRLVIDPKLNKLRKNFGSYVK